MVMLSQEVRLDSALTQPVGGMTGDPGSSSGSMCSEWTDSPFAVATNQPAHGLTTPSGGRRRRRVGNGAANGSILGLTASMSGRGVSG